MSRGQSRETQWQKVRALDCGSFPRLPYCAVGKDRSQIASLYFCTMVLLYNVKERLNIILR